MKNSSIGIAIAAILIIGNSLGGPIFQYTLTALGILLIIFCGVYHYMNDKGLL